MLCSSDLARQVPDREPLPCMSRSDCNQGCAFQPCESLLTHHNASERHSPGPLGPTCGVAWKGIWKGGVPDGRARRPGTGGGSWTQPPGA